MPFFSHRNLYYKLELVYSFTCLGPILVGFFNFLILMHAVSDPFFGVKVLRSRVITETSLNVKMLEANSSCYQVCVDDILLTLTPLGV